MKKFLIGSFLLIALLAIVYFMGPHPKAPDLISYSFQLPDSLALLETQINQREFNTKGLKPDNQARIVWADSNRKEKTRIAFLYLHGFTASYGDGKPVATNVAKEFNSNIYLFRNAHHGVDLGDSTMINANADDFVFESERALAIAKKLGDEVIVVGTSLGGALTLDLASRHPEIKAIVLYAPAAVPDNGDVKLVSGPWGFQIAKAITGSEYINNPDTVKLHQQYWQMHVHLNGMVATTNFVRNALGKDVYGRIHCPVFMGYYFKNEQEQDQSISKQMMLEMFSQLGTPVNLKKEIAFENAGDHVIASELISKEWERVESETVKWLREVVIK